MELKDKSSSLIVDEKNLYELNINNSNISDINFNLKVLKAPKI